MEREPHTEVAIGETGVGKTWQTDIKVKRYPKIHNEPVLILDFNDEYSEVHTINIYSDRKRKVKGIEHFDKPWIRRIRPFNTDGSKMSFAEKLETAKYVAEKFKNGLLVIDDPDKYMVFAQAQEITGILMGNRHAGLDIILAHQAWATMSTMEWRNLTLLRVHKTTDTPQSVPKDKISTNLPICSIAYQIVEDQYNAKNHRYFNYVNIRKQKIWGCKKQNFDFACSRYIFNNPKIIKEEIREMEFYKLIEKKDRNSQDTQQLAMHRAIEKLGRYYSDKPVLVNN